MPSSMEEIIALVLKTSGQEGLTKLAEEAIKVKDALNQVAVAEEVVEKKTLDLSALSASGQGLFAAFQSGELPGIIQGIGGLVELVPGLNNFAPIIKKIGDVSEVAWPFVKDFYKALKDEPEKVAKAAEAVVDYGERVNDLGETVKNLTDRQGTLNAELSRQNKLLEEQKKWMVELAALRPQKGPYEAEESAQEKERADILSSALGGEQDNIIEDVAKTLRERARASEAKILADLRSGATSFGDLPQKQREDIASGKMAQRLAAIDEGPVSKEIEEKATQMVADAVRGGKEGALRDVVGALPEGERRGILEEQLPETKKDRADQLKAYEDEQARARMLKEAAAAPETAEAIEAAKAEAAKADADLAKSVLRNTEREYVPREAPGPKRTEASAAQALMQMQRQMRMQGATIDTDQSTMQGLMAALQQEDEKNKARYAKSHELHSHGRTASSNGLP